MIGTRVRAVEKYLRDWAEPEISLASALGQTYERTLVVPACREDVSLLDGYLAAARTSRGRTLCILVVNGAEGASDEHHAENAHLFEAVIAKLESVQKLEGLPRAVLGTLERSVLDVLVLDRASEGARLPRKEGVGLARKIGCDLALALYVRESVRSPFVFSTDADATLPDAFFDQPALEARADVAAAVFPFWHTASRDADITRATSFYEVSLRYYVEGLAWAGSPYAFHTLGSAIAIRAESYAAVRGMPKREAGEDFYLLNKLAKIGAIVRVPAAAIRLASRASDRTPFGTGRSVREAIASADFKLYSPTCFVVLRDLLARLEAFSEHADVERLFSEFSEIEELESALLEQWDARSALEGARREAKTTEMRRSRVHTWLDAFRTLKVIHAVRDGGSPALPWREAIAAAPFLDRTELLDADAAFVDLRTRMASAEAARSARSRY